MIFRKRIQPRACLGQAATLLLLASLASAPAWARTSDEFNRGGLEKMKSDAGGKEALQRGSERSPEIASATTAPPYAVCGRWNELQQLIVARTPDGPVSALDLLMFDQMTGNMLGQMPVEALLEPHQEKYAAQLPLIRDALRQMAGFERVAKLAGDWRPEEDEVRNLCYGPAIAVFALLDTQPQVRVDSSDVSHYYLSHPELYLARRRVQVRYIFVPVDTHNTEKTQAASDQLSRLAGEVKAGRQDFAAAAQKLSQAPSAKQGGLIPPFYNGTYFQKFEEQAFSLLSPGELSGIFEGPGGLYIQQLTQAWPARNIPVKEVAPDIAKQLAASHIKFYYQHDLQKLQEKIYTVNNGGYWEYLDLDAPLAQVGDNTLTREEFFRYFPNPINAAYDVQWSIVLHSVERWLEGETIMQAIEARQQIAHPFLDRGRELAIIALRAKHVLRDPSFYQAASTPDKAAAALLANPAFGNFARSVRLVGIQVTPKKGTAAGLPGAQRETENITLKLGGGVLPSTPADIKLLDWWRSNGNPAREPSRDALGDLKESVERSQWENVTLKLDDLGWVAVTPGSPWAAVLRATQPGQLTPAQQVGNTSTFYFNLAQKPMNLMAWKAKPLMLQNIAIALGVYDYGKRNVKDAQPGLQILI